MKLFKKIAFPSLRKSASPARLIIFFLFFTCCTSLSWAQPFREFSSFVNPACAEQEKRDNEFAYTGQPNGIFYCNPLMLGDMAFNYNAFTLESKGELRLTKGESKSGKEVEIPFYLRLRRNGILVTHACSEGVIFSKVEISVILKVAQDGDELIIEPVNKEDWPAKRIVKIGGDGC
jgi:hypothetical protein